MVDFTKLCDSLRFIRRGRVLVFSTHHNIVYKSNNPIHLYTKLPATKRGINGHTWYFDAYNAHDKTTR